MIVVGDVFRIRMIWTLRGERWSNVVHTTLVAGSAPNLEKAASASLHSANQFRLAAMAMLPSSVTWECNIVDRLTGPLTHRQSFPVHLNGDILTEEPLPPDQALMVDYYAGDTDPAGKGRIFLSAISEQITRGTQIMFLRFPTVQGFADGFGLPFSASGATFRFAVKLRDGNFHLAEFGRFFTSVRTLGRRRRELCGSF